MDEKNKIKSERWKLLIRLGEFLEGPMIFLGFLWLILIILELTIGQNNLLGRISILIWIIFIIDFIISFIIAPVKKIFLKKNTLTIISLIVPAFRIFRLFRFVRLLRSLRLVKILGSINRGMKSLASTMKRRAFGYMLLLTVLVIFGGSAGMYSFEHQIPGGLNSYMESLWWTAMLVNTVGTEYWPQTVEGRILCYLLSLYGFAILGYITANIASFFIGKDAVDNNRDNTSSKKIQELKNEIEVLKDLIKKSNEGKNH